MADVKERLLQKDCFECRVTGTAGCFAIGSFIIYSSMASFYQKRPLGRLAVQGLGAGAFYLSASRWFRLPPFSHLRDDIDE